MLVTCLLNQANVFCLTSLDVSTSLLVGPLGHWFIIPCLLVFWFDCCFFGFFGLIVVFFCWVGIAGPNSYYSRLNNTLPNSKRGGKIFVLCRTVRNNQINENYKRIWRWSAGCLGKLAIES